MTGKWGSGEMHGKLELVRVIWVIQYKQCYPMTPYKSFQNRPGSLTLRSKSILEEVVSICIESSSIHG